MARKTTETSGDVIYEAIASYVGAHGQIAAGTRLRGDHPAIAANPEFWVREADREARATALLTLAATAADASWKGDEPGPPDIGVGFARAIRTVTAIIARPHGTPEARHVSRGSVVPADDPVVAAAPGDFDAVMPDPNPVTRAEMALREEQGRAALFEAFKRDPGLYRRWLDASDEEAIEIRDQALTRGRAEKWSALGPWRAPSRRPRPVEPDRCFACSRRTTSLRVHVFVVGGRRLVLCKHCLFNARHN